MREIIRGCLQQAIECFKASKIWPEALKSEIFLDDTRYLQQGFFATPLPFELAKLTGRSALEWVSLFQTTCILPKEISALHGGAQGFLNIEVPQKYLVSIISTVLAHPLGTITPKDDSMQQVPKTVTYADQRIHWVESMIQESLHGHQADMGSEERDILTHVHERQLLLLLDRCYDAMMMQNKRDLIMNHVKDLANELHSYYNAINFLCDDLRLRSARLKLLQAIAQVFESVILR